MRAPGKKAINTGMGFDPYSPTNPITAGTSDAGYVDLAELARTNPEVAMQYAGGELDGSAVPDFSGLSQRDWDTVTQGVQQTQSDLAQQQATDPLNDRFGGDLSWLDQLFEDDPTAALTTARGMGTTADPAAQQAQQKALDELMGIYNSGGLGAQDRAARAKARAESENWLKGKREASRQSLASRGMLGSGAELAMDLGDSQGAASRLSAADLQASADAEKRALDALLAGGSLSTTMRDASDSYVRSNADVISKAREGNKQFLRDAWADMMKRRNDWDTNVFNAQTGVAGDMRDRDERENATGFGFAQDTATADANARNAAQTNQNTGQVGAFTGMTPGVQGAGAAVTGLTGDRQRAAGQGFSGGAAFAGNLISSLYGGKGGQQQSGETKKNGATS